MYSYLKFKYLIVLKFKFMMGIVSNLNYFEISIHGGNKLN